MIEFKYLVSDANDGYYQEFDYIKDAVQAAVGYDGFGVEFSRKENIMCLFTSTKHIGNNSFDIESNNAFHFPGVSVLEDDEHASIEICQKLIEHQKKVHAKYDSLRIDVLGYENDVLVTVNGWPAGEPQLEKSVFPWNLPQSPNAKRVRFDIKNGSSGYATFKEAADVARLGGIIRIIDIDKPMFENLVAEVPVTNLKYLCLKETSSAFKLLLEKQNAVEKEDRAVQFHYLANANDAANGEVYLEENGYMPSQLGYSDLDFYGLGCTFEDYEFVGWTE